MSSVSSSASSSLCCCTRLAKRSNTSMRARGARPRQRRSFQAVRAFATAISMSAAWPRAMCASTAPVAGLTHSKVSPAFAGTWRPSINRPVVICSRAALASQSSWVSADAIIRPPVQSDIPAHAAPAHKPAQSGAPPRAIGLGPPKGHAPAGRSAACGCPAPAARRAFRQSR